MPENKYAKAIRLYEAGAIRLVEISGTERRPEYVFAVDGDHGTYRVELDDLGADCDCPSTRRCSHEIAVRVFHAGLRSLARSRAGDPTNDERPK